ncbi:MAG TPA: DNA mismatch repair protein MutS, partial [Salinimicrobium sp.]|nr:DNA mismatch repair protein MutS [Salinimicrobium sp.]
MIKPGDKVAVLDDELEGNVVSVEGDKITIETSEGFRMDFRAAELVKLDSLEVEGLLETSAIFPEMIKEKEAYKKPKSQRTKPKERNLPPMEVDLHIHKLTNSSRGMSNFDMLNLQIDTVKRQLEFAMKKRIQKIVFIHG